MEVEWGKGQVDGVLPLFRVLRHGQVVGSASSVFTFPPTALLLFL